MGRSRRSDRLRIAMIGQKGLPATFGGIEHHVEELGARLVERGHEVTVFCRQTYGGGTRNSVHRGMRLVAMPTVGTKHLDAIVHSAVSTTAAMRAGVDIIHYHAIGPGALALLPRVSPGVKVLLTVHGLDEQRAKWSPPARAMLRTAGWLSARVPDTTIVVSRDLERHYREVRRRRTVYIPNGVSAPEPEPAAPQLRRLGLDGRPYLLFVGRFVPEKAPDLLVRAAGQVPGDYRLVLAGGSSFTDRYVDALRQLAAGDPRVVFPGYVFGAELAALYAGAAAFVLPSYLEGLPLTLLEAAAFGTPVVASDIGPHREVLGASGPGHRLFPPGDERQLAATLRAVLADGVQERRGAAALREGVLRTYDWDAATDATERAYRDLLDRRGRLPWRRGARRTPALDGAAAGPAAANGAARRRSS